MKRAHLGAQRLGRALLEPFGLTPARFDLLNTIVDGEQDERITEGMTQSELTRRLGVVRSAVCEMVQALVGLGIVKRRRAEDARTWVVELSELGRRVQKEAFDALINDGVATQWADSLITNRLDIDPAPIRHEWTQIFFSIGTRLGNAVRNNHDLYTWDIEEFYADLITPADRDMYFGTLPWVDEVDLELIPIPSSCDFTRASTS